MAGRLIKDLETTLNTNTNDFVILEQYNGTKKIKIRDLKKDITSENTNQINIIHTEGANVKRFGAKGDGATDDTKAFKLALESNSHIYVPDGIYIVGDLELKKGQLLTGNSTYIYSWRQEFKPTILKAREGANYTIKDARGSAISHIQICGNNRKSNGIYCGYSSSDPNNQLDGNTSLFDVRIFDANIGLEKLRNGSSVFKCQLDSNNYAIKGSTDSRITNCVINKNIEGLYLEESNDNIISNNKIEWNDGNGIYIDGMNNKVNLNTIDRNSVGIYIQNGTSSLFTTNICRRNVSFNIVVQRLEFSQVCNNICKKDFKDSENEGITVPDIHMKLKTIRDSIITENTFIFGTPFDLTELSKTYTIIKDNIGNNVIKDREVISRAILLQPNETKNVQVPYPFGYNNKNCFILSYKVGESNYNFLNYNDKITTRIKLSENNIELMLVNNDLNYRMTANIEIVIGII